MSTEENVDTVSSSTSLDSVDTVGERLTGGFF